jgi:hypothetical protein
MAGSRRAAFGQTLPQSAILFGPLLCRLTGVDRTLGARPSTAANRPKPTCPLC